jgi:hypothetical protein
MLRFRHGFCCACILLGVILLDPLMSPGQPGEGGGRGGGGFGGERKGKGGGGFNDPERLFGFWAKGGNTIDFSRMDPNQKAFARSTFEKMGMPTPGENTVITKAQFVESFNKGLAAKGMTPATPGSPQGYGGGGFSGKQGYGGGPGYGGGGPGYGGGVQSYGGGPGYGGGGRQERPAVMTFGPGGMQQGGPPGGFSGRGFGPPGQSSYGQGSPGFSQGGPPGFGKGDRGDRGDQGGGDRSFRMTDQDIEKRFADQDLNKDGKLSLDEISDRSPLKASFKETDTNGDNSIDLTEYKAYIAARFGGDESGSYGSYAGNGNYGRDGRDKKEKEELPVAIRYGKLPAGLPSWWDGLDTDKDGQIGLYEWRADGRDIKEFQKMDLDGDGLLAPQEWQRYNVLATEQAKAIAAEEEIGGSTPSPRGNRPSGVTPGGGSTGGGMKGGGNWPNKGSDSKGSDSRGSDGKDGNPFRGGGKKRN